MEHHPVPTEHFRLDRWILPPALPLLGNASHNGDADLVTLWDMRRRLYETWLTLLQRMQKESGNVMAVTPLELERAYVQHDQYLAYSCTTLLRDSTSATPGLWKWCFATGAGSAVAITQPEHDRSFILYNMVILLWQLTAQQFRTDESVAMAWNNSSLYAQCRASRVRQLIEYFFLRPSSHVQELQTMEVFPGPLVWQSLYHMILMLETVEWNILRCHVLPTPSTDSLVIMGSAIRTLRSYSLKARELYRQLCEQHLAGLYLSRKHQGLTLHVYKYMIQACFVYDIAALALLVRVYVQKVTLFGRALHYMRLLQKVMASPVVVYRLCSDGATSSSPAVATVTESEEDTGVAAPALVPRSVFQVDWSAAIWTTQLTHEMDPRIVRGVLRLAQETLQQATATAAAMSFENTAPEDLATLPQVTEWQILNGIYENVPVAPTPTIQAAASAIPAPSAEAMAWAAAAAAGTSV